ncbi:MAG: Glycosyl transferase family 2 [Parcubacteria group bacterium GW2011_GWA1_36_12]|nr:MAG: Glycosyl transferase family 2 [Parcubacteria group bacterium GW2011_GWA1_36_12]
MQISALILTKNEEEVIEDCLKSIKDLANEIIILDQNSTDNTINIAKKYADKVINTNFSEFDKNRNILKDSAKSKWLLYLDSDERLTEELRKEIVKVIKEDKYSAFYIPRKNYVLGKNIKHGGWWPDYVPKLFKKEQLKGWIGVVHESPIFRGESVRLVNPIEHLTARSLNRMLEKTIKWAKIEAMLAYEANHPQVNSARVTKVFIDEFISRYLLKRGLLDGVQGLIQALFQSYHRSIMLVYLWEKQNNTEEKFNTIKNV